MIFTRENPGEIGCLAFGEGDSQPVTEGRRKEKQEGRLSRGASAAEREEAGPGRQPKEEGRRRSARGWAGSWAVRWAKAGGRGSAGPVAG